MVKLHHLNQSRSKRVIWALEELGVPYQIVPYQRDTTSMFAPPELKKIHPLGKSPVIDDDGTVVAESGAILEYLVEKYGAGKLAPVPGARDRAQYLHWMHFAEGSAMFPLLLRLFVRFEGTPTRVLGPYAEQQLAAVLGYMNGALAKSAYLAGDQFSAADILNSYILEMAAPAEGLKPYPKLAPYLERITSRPGAKRADELEKKHDQAGRSYFT
ncbi:MAG: glutathione S-transferase family protein [Myxococcota bacterium]